MAEGIVAPRSHVVLVSTADGLKFTKPFANDLFEGVNILDACDTDTVAAVIMGDNMG